MENWNVIQGIGTLTIGGIAIWIARQQWKINKSKFKFELYSKRYEIFQVVNRFYWAAIEKSNVTHEELSEFKLGIREADFLFKSDVIEFLEELLKRAVKLKLFQSLYRNNSQEPHPENYDHENIVAKIYDTEMWFADNLDRSKLVFKPYLDLSDQI